MTTKTRLLSLDEALLPGTKGEVGLEDGEAHFIAGGELDSDKEISTLVLGYPRSGDQKDGFLEAGLLVQGVLWPARGDDLPARLVISQSSRVRIDSVVQGDEGPIAAFGPWPYERSDLEKVNALVERFYRILLVTRDPDDEGMKTQLEEPISELEELEDEVDRLFLLSDYLFDSEDVRREVLKADSTAHILEKVSKTMDMLESELPASPKSVRHALMNYLDAASNQGTNTLHSTLATLNALAPLLKPSEGALKELTSLVQDTKVLHERFESLTLRLLSRGPR